MRLMSSTILNEIRDLVLNASPPKYKEVLALDHKLRDCSPKLFLGQVGARNVRKIGEFLCQIDAYSCAGWTGGVERAYHPLNDATVSPFVL